MSLLTTKEQCVMDALSDAWNEFCGLPSLHPDESDELRAIIHAAQTIIMARPVQREINEEEIHS